MKTEYLYVIIDVNGAAWAVVGRMTEKTVVGRMTEKADLPNLLREGWRPVRETPFPIAPSGQAYILICLEREPEGQMGFGFGT